MPRYSSARRSQRVYSRRYWGSQDRVRSTTHCSVLRPESGVGGCVGR